MNWFAHVFLSKNDVEYQLGNLLADPLKGKAWTGASQGIIDGMAMHRVIDTFTDSHPVVSLSKTRLKKRGPLKGVVVDVLYDHFLSRHWREYASVDLSNFVASFNARAVRAAERFPERPAQIVRGVAHSNLLGQYQDFSGVVNSLERINRRLSPRVLDQDSTLSYVAPIASRYSELEADFEAFFPELLAYFEHYAYADSSPEHCLSTVSDGSAR